MTQPRLQPGQLGVPVGAVRGVDLLPGRDRGPALGAGEPGRQAGEQLPYPRVELPVGLADQARQVLAQQSEGGAEDLRRRHPPLHQLGAEPVADARIERLRGDRGDDLRKQVLQAEAGTRQRAGHKPAAHDALQPDPGQLGHRVGIGRAAVGVGVPHVVFLP
jgi:hypothetical protein